ncbi:NADH-quinone oxidoreductase subunit N [Actinoplanes sp. NBRC 103695]|uniref:NADH-quinone oxidoreductase subunit N n=1 Tax=Actinoplanes sp. NBRC 103695 TaxID=3032202 RepID=UPI0024A0E6B4|nr:NADH-quinone oxidoreductase subunit N [Actinoplanes sp. NBRC 103695]GLY96258.1 NADH-quinone oxidoreductase subunit N [Actinoplanes sp. NBRC 103695]
MIQSINHLALLPLYAAAGTAVLVLLVDLTAGRRSAIFGTAAAGSLITAVVALYSSGESTFCTGALCSWSGGEASTVIVILFSLLTLGVLGLSTRTPAPPGEFCFLLVCSMAGGVVVAYAGDLVTLIVGLETLTLPLYVLTGLRRTIAGAASAVTFFLVSVVSTAIALLGAGLIYAATGALHLAALDPHSGLTSGSAPVAGPLLPLAAVGAALLVIGFAFKIAAVPLHAWAPATYDGAPLPVAAYLSTASKLGGVVALAAIVSRLDTGPLIPILAVLTMTVGNLVALRQTRMVRLLAWSSVAQAGYILAPLSAGVHGVEAALAYATFFVVLEFIAFAVIVALLPPDAHGGDIASYRGAGRRSPWPAALFVLALSGLAGLPPGLAGLFAKVTIVDTLIDHGWGWLAGVVAVNAVIALAYYVRTAAILYAPAPGLAVADLRLPKLPIRWPVAATLIGATALAVVLGFFPQLVYDAVGMVTMSTL